MDSDQRSMIREGGFRRAKNYMVVDLHTYALRLYACFILSSKKRYRREGFGDENILSNTTPYALERYLRKVYALQLNYK